MRVGEANIRMSLTPGHSLEQIDTLVEAVEFSIKKGKEIFEKGGKVAITQPKL